MSSPRLNEEVMPTMCTCCSAGLELRPTIYARVPTWDVEMLMDLNLSCAGIKLYVYAQKTSSSSIPVDGATGFADSSICEKQVICVFITDLIGGDGKTPALFAVNLVPSGR
ncbi:hypothetical protein Ancab_031229 [Ancistrocladus abbreviatus]